MAVFARNYIQACEGYGWEGGPEFNTDIVEMVNKAEKRNARWSQSRFFATLPFLNIRPELYGYILDMFEDRMGRWGVFLYRNPLNFSASGAIFGMGDGVTKTFQLAYSSEVGGRVRMRNAYAIYSPSPTGDGSAIDPPVSIYVNGIAAAGVTIDRDRGLVTFASAPADDAELTWDGEFSHWVRFANDRLPFSIDNRASGEFATNGMVELTEVNPPRDDEL